MNRRQMISACAAALVGAPGSGASATPGDLRGDVSIIRRALALHPGVYRYAAPSDLDARLAAREMAFGAAPTPEARYLILSRFLATLRCGHSYANFFNQTEAVALDLFDRRTRLPVHVVWRAGRMLVAADPSGFGLPVGGEVTSVNGVAAGDLLTRLIPYARADGHNDGKRASLLGVTGAAGIEYFDVFHGLVFGAPPGGAHSLVVRRPEGGVVRLETPAFGLAERRAQTPRRNASRSEAVWDWVVREDGVALLTMPSWALYDSPWNWRAWLEARLDSLQSGPGLVIDLRGNEGGNDCGDAILARLARSPIERPRIERRVRFRRTPADLDPHLDTWDESFRTLGVGAADRGDGFYTLPEARGDDRVLPQGRPLKGRAAVLIGPVNSSATFQFAERARASGLVRLFGETTGGNQRGINGGGFFFVRLPASGLEFDLPLIGEFPPGRPPDAGLPPDVQVSATAADMAAHLDPALETAARWVAKG